MRFISTRTSENEDHKHKIMGKLCCKAQEQRQMRLLIVRRSVNDVAKHKNKNKDTRTSTRSRANYVAKRKNNDK